MKLKPTIAITSAAKISADLLKMGRILVNYALYLKTVVGFGTRAILEKLSQAIKCHQERKNIIRVRNYDAMATMLSLVA